MRASLALLLVWLLNPSLTEAVDEVIAFVRTGSIAHAVHHEANGPGHECPPTHAHCLCCERGAIAPTLDVVAVRMPAPQVSAHPAHPELRWDDVASAPPFRPPIA